MSKEKLASSLNMARGKPCVEQLDLSGEFFDALTSKDNFVIDGVDIRNYGALDGLESAKKLLGDIVGADKEDVIVFGNSSLNIMFDLVSKGYSHGICGSKAWCKRPKVKWLCPVPGYDRHFSIGEYFDIEMINIPMNEYGPDMDLVESLIKDESVKGIWCVPQYSNPSGITYSDEVVKRFANLKPAAKDFRIYWDNAYALHHLYNDKEDKLLNIIDECKKAGNPDLVYEFVSTSKITFPGGGIAGLVTSSKNREDVLNSLKYQTICFDKINQYRHVKYLEDINNINALMKKHADIIRPKFELVESIFEKDLNGIASWSKPNGGYFITLYVKGIAKEVISKCKEKGLVLTEAGCAFPYHKDPSNSVIRIAPTYPSLDELDKAAHIICESIKECQK